MLDKRAQTSVFSRQFLLQTAEDLEMIILNIPLNKREEAAFVKTINRLKKEAGSAK